MVRTIMVAMAALALSGGAAFAQKGPQAQQQQYPDWRQPPRYATINLQAGFEPDPREVHVEAGGDREATGIGRDCSGWIDFSKPDVDLNYTAGQYPLYISVVSNADTTLVINDSQGNWICNDDMEGNNPGIVLERPQSGNYNIWIGTFDRSQPQRAVLRISEMPPQRR